MKKEKLRYKNNDFFVTPYWVDPIADFETTIERPVVIICPGGGFKFLSDREAQPIAFKFNALGMHAIVLNYSLIDKCHPIYPLALQELSTTLNWIYQKKSQKHINLSKVLLIGFSAGGNVVANYNSLMLDKNHVHAIFSDEILITPVADILCYPVIDLTLGWPKCKSQINEISKDTLYWKPQDTLTCKGVPTFIWHTVTDELVSAQNSLTYMSKMTTLGIPYEAHLFGSGAHGLSLATCVTKDPGHESQISENNSIWWRLMVNWLKSRKIVPYD